MNSFSAKFSVLHKARNRAMLDMLEAVCITTREPELCKQMQFVKNLHLLRGSERNERWHVAHSSLQVYILVFVFSVVSQVYSL